MKRFTVELQRTIVKTARIEVTGEDIAEARQKALIKARSDYLWEVDPGTTRVLKITAHTREAT